MAAQAQPHPLQARVAAIHAKAKRAGKVRPPAPPRDRLPLDLPPERRDLG